MKSKYYVKSLEEFIRSVDDITRTWEDECGDFIYPWFRGHANCSFSLLPSIYRDSKLIENEDSYRQDFMFKAHPFLDQSYYKPTNDLEWYFLMQHYGLPTRLLDWTEGSLIALHFAINYKREDDNSNPCVWVLNPHEFNKKFTGVDEIFTDGKYLGKYISKLWSKTSLPKNPVAIQPQINSKRISSQKGCFMMYGADRNDITKEQDLQKHLIKIEIDIEPLEEIIDSLIVTGITESIIYPELSGLAREIQQYYRY